MGHQEWNLHVHECMVQLLHTCICPTSSTSLFAPFNIHTCIPSACTMFNSHSKAKYFAWTAHVNAQCHIHVPCNYNLYFYWTCNTKINTINATCIINVHVFNLTIWRRVIAAAFSMASCLFLICDPWNLAPSGVNVTMQL